VTSVAHLSGSIPGGNPAEHGPGTEIAGCHTLLLAVAYSVQLVSVDPAGTARCLLNSQSSERLQNLFAVMPTASLMHDADFWMGDSYVAVVFKNGDLLLDASFLDSGTITW
jgi:hypothetical protein